MEFFLMDDAWPIYGPKKELIQPYAKKGDKVTMIADHENIIIVEDEKGNRFPVKTGLLSNDPVPEQREEKPTIPEPIKTKKKKSLPVSQNKLF